MAEAELTALLSFFLDCIPPVAVLGPHTPLPSPDSSDALGPADPRGAGLWRGHGRRKKDGRAPAMKQQAVQAWQGHGQTKKASSACVRRPRPLSTRKAGIPHPFPPSFQTAINVNPRVQTLRW